MNPYVPIKLPLPSLDANRLIQLVGKANRYVSEFDNLLRRIVNPEILLSVVKTEEAVASSRIEGTQATINDVWDCEAGVKKSPQIQNDVQEVKNYRNALTQVQLYLDTYPFSLAAIRQAHKILMDSVRGKDKNPGEFRKIQNWIGVEGTKMENAVFIPPSPFLVEEYLQNWIDYFHSEDVDELIQLAVLHAQFELIHPFCDGNGRIGRLIIPFFLYVKKRITSPAFFLSRYLEKNRQEYCQKLNNISNWTSHEDSNVRLNGWNDWVEYFLKAIVEQTQKDIPHLTALLNLYEKTQKMVMEITHSQYSLQIAEALFQKPVFTTPEFIQFANIPKNSAGELLHKLSPSLIQVESGKGRIPNRWNFTEFNQEISLYLSEYSV